LYNLPPTDPRFLALTDEQIELDWQHYLLDHPDLAKKDAYIDPEYEEWERKAIEEDSKITYTDAERNGSDEKISRAIQEKALDSQYSDWEEVPIADE
jgi:hypothetical protein